MGLSQTPEILLSFGLPVTPLRDIFEAFDAFQGAGEP